MLCMGVAVGERGYDRRYHDSDEVVVAYAASTDDDAQVMLILEPERIVVKDYN